MARTLKLEKGKLVDVESLPHKEFKGVATRDLEVGDVFETIHDFKKGIVLMKTNIKQTNEDGTQLIVSGSV